MRIGAEVAKHVSELASEGFEGSELLRELGDRIARGDFKSLDALEKVRKIDEKEAKWLKKFQKKSRR